jgi:tripartite-type tricarboxylate transporter receptor subunit TctC
MRLIPIICMSISLVLSAGAVASAETAVNYPNGNVKIIVPFSAGGPTDVIMRIVADQLSKRWKQNVIVENRPGAGTILATQAVAKSPADGHTIGVSTNSYVINAAINTNLPYDTLKDFSNVSMVVTQPLVLVAHPSFPANTIAELVEYAKKSPAPLNYASPGPRGSAHLAGVLLADRAGIKMTHINYKGSAPALTDVIAGRVPLMFDIWHSSKPHVETGKLKVIATVGPERIPDLPKVPTIAETYPGLSAVAFQALFVRAGLPQPVLEKLSADIRAVVESKEFKDKVSKFSVTPMATTPKQQDEWTRSEVAKWAAIAKAANITVK